MSAALTLVFLAVVLPAASRDESVTRVVQVVPAMPGVSASGVTVWLRGPVSTVETLTDSTGRAVFRTPRSAAQVGCSGEEIWCVASPVRLTQTEISLPIWPLVTISGAVSVSDGESLPTTVVVQVHGGIPSDVGPIEKRVPVVAGLFSALAPPGVHDVRLAFENFSPVYFWGVDIRGERYSLGPIRLRKGASISGTVVETDTEKPVKDLLVRLTPGSAPSAPPETTAWNQTKTGPTGFFQFQNVPMGQHLVSFLKGDRLVSVLGPLDVPRDSEVRLDAFSLKPPVELGLTFTPPLSPDGDRWVAQLIAETPMLSALPLNLKSTGGEEGDVTFRNLIPGSYMLIVSSDDQRVLFERIDLSATSHQSRELKTRRIRGRVYLGNQPIEASLAFSSGDGDRVVLMSDKDGRFSGWTKTGKGNLFVRVATENPRITKDVILDRSLFGTSESDLDIRLDDIRVAGRVADPQGRPRAGITIKAESGPSDFVTTVSGDDGGFELRPLSPSPYLVTAFDRNYPRSRPIEFHGARPPERLDIVLEKGLPLRVQVLTPDGAPVPGAQVKVDPIGFASSYFSQPTTASGSLQIPIPAETSRLFVRVVSESLGAWSGCLSMPDEGAPLTILLSGPPFAYGEFSLNKAPTTPSALVSAEGAAWSVGDLLSWPRALRGSEPEMLGLTQGSYAVLSTSEPWERFIERWCTVGPPSGLTWTPLLIGAPSEIGFGVKVP